MTSPPKEDTRVDLRITCPVGAEALLADECKRLRVGTRRSRGSVRALTTLERGLRIILSSRLAQRLTWNIAAIDAHTPGALYAGALEVPWEQWLTTESTFAVWASGGNPRLRHARFIAQRVKDALCDRIRRRSGSRPDVELDSPTVAVTAHVAGDRAWLGLDFAGEGLHQRGYRTESGDAPLRETLAAAMLEAAGWEGKRSLIDPMCGSGTIAIEAALSAMNRAPGLKHEPAVLRWPHHGDEARAHWATWTERAREAELEAPGTVIVSSDHDAAVVEVARRNAERAGVAQHIQFAVSDARDAPVPMGPGVAFANPPYGQRLGDPETEAPAALASWSAMLRAHPDFEGFCLTPMQDAASRIGQRTRGSLQLLNGPLECTLHRTPARNR